jgi:hypothetical protein
MRALTTRGEAARRAIAGVLLMLTAGIPPDAVQAGEIVGVTVTPHVIAEEMRYRRGREGGLAARVQLFVRGAAASPKFEGKSPAELLQAGQWAWHDLAAARPAPEGALSVWTFNGKAERWGVGQAFSVEAEGLRPKRVRIAKPERWVSALTFLSSNGGVEPDTLVAHFANETSRAFRVTRLRFWLPREGATWQTLWPRPPLAVNAHVPAHDKGYLKVRVDRLPLTYAAVEFTTSAGTLWAHLRIKREVFDISGGWVGDHVRHEAFLRLLSRLHMNTAHIGAVAGYTDNPALYNRYPLKLFNKLAPIAEFDTPEWLPKIHAVEFLGEPQYGGGRPVPPQEVFDQLLPYRPSRLPTTVTHSEERIWRWYAGLSDYPHYDAYRVVAPSADQWTLYDRWGGRRIRWGAPLETIGDMCRSLRELNRPVPCAYWSQGPHHGWSNPLDGRARRSPTPDELRAQALHALATRITSLYWFNLSLRSLLAFPDTWDEMTRIGREIRMLETFYLEGDAYRFERRKRADGAPDWDLASIAAPEAALLFALDTAYTASPTENVFVFGAPRPARFAFDLPAWLRRPTEVFRVDAEGTHSVTWRATAKGVEIEDTRSRDAIYVAAKSPAVKRRIEEIRKKALAHEAAHPVDMATLQALLAR